jgi:formate dehydrogenase subunit gamma
MKARTAVAIIKRYSMEERVVHWTSALTYMYVLGTGLAFYSPHLYWIAVILGGAPTSRFWHPIIGLVFIASLAVMLRSWMSDMRITTVDRAWGRSINHYIANEDEELPPADRFNLGQKYFFWVMIWGGIGLLISGAILWFPELIPWNLRFLRSAGILVHVGCALITIGAFIIHVYMGTAMVRGGFTSIIRGEVSPAWARSHHRLWYERMAGK